MEARMKALPIRTLAMVVTFGLGSLALAAGCQLVSGVGDLGFVPAPPAAGGEGGGGSGANGGNGGDGGGDAGGGGAPECTVPGDCTGTDTTCLYRSCDNGICGMTEADAATSCSEDGGQVCDGQGNCVECLVTGQCAMTFVCLDEACVPGACVDTMQNNDETDVDCGGADCPPCDNGDMCLLGRDCETGFCDVDTCAACGNDGDCSALPDTYCDAGICTPKKAPGDGCGTGNECLSGFCPAQDHVCCGSPCSGKCVSCVGSETNLGQTGVCDNVQQGTDPENECLLACNGSGDCQL
jgi:hypothetical protein